MRTYIYTLLFFLALNVSVVAEDEHLSDEAYGAQVEAEAAELVAEEKAFEAEDAQAESMEVYERGNQEDIEAVHSRQFEAEGEAIKAENAAIEARQEANQAAQDSN